MSRVVSHVAPLLLDQRTAPSQNLGEDAPTSMLYLQVEMKGLTGTIKFDQHGLRTDFTLEVVELKKDGLVKVIFATRYIQLVLSLKDAPSKRKVFFRATTAKVF